MGSHKVETFIASGNMVLESPIAASASLRRRSYRDDDCCMRRRSLTERALVRPEDHACIGSLPHEPRHSLVLTVEGAHVLPRHSRNHRG